jgi:hypothetical protein
MVVSAVCVMQARTCRRIAPRHQVRDPRLSFCLELSLKLCRCSQIRLRVCLLPRAQLRLPLPLAPLRAASPHAACLVANRDASPRASHCRCCTGDAASAAAGSAASGASGSAGGFEFKLAGPFERFATQLEVHCVTLLAFHPLLISPWRGLRPRCCTGDSGAAGSARRGAGPETGQVCPPGPLTSLVCRSTVPYACWLACCSAVQEMRQMLASQVQQRAGGGARPKPRSFVSF